MAGQKTLEERIAASREKCDRIAAEHRAIAARLAEAQDELDALVGQVPAFASSEDNVRATQDYLQRQREILQERGERQKHIEASGLDLKALAKSLKAPIDAARAR